MKRIMQVIDIVNVVWFLVFDQSFFMMGIMLEVDGGCGIQRVEYIVDDVGFLEVIIKLYVFILEKFRRIFIFVVYYI